MKQALLIGLAVLLLAGCGGHVLSQEALRQVDDELDLTQVLATPDAFVGRTLLLGGPILDIQVGREGTTLEVLNYRLDRWGEPRAQRAGRFLVVTEQFLDPEIYRVGTYVTLTGTVRGSEVRPLRDGEYRYPLLAAGEVHRWSPRYYTTPDYYWPSPYWNPYQPWSMWGYPPYYFHDPWYRPWRHPGWW
jgi:outer membrane lipoprotein